MNYIEQVISEYKLLAVKKLNTDMGDDTKIMEFLEKKLQQAFELGKEQKVSATYKSSKMYQMAYKEGIAQRDKELLEWCEENKSFEDNYPNEDIIYLDKLTKHLTN